VKKARKGVYGIPKERGGKIADYKITARKPKECEECGCREQNNKDKEANFD